MEHLKMISQNPQMDPFGPDSLINRTKRGYKRGCLQKGLPNRYFHTTLNAFLAWLFKGENFLGGEDKIAPFVITSDRDICSHKKWHIYIGYNKFFQKLLESVSWHQKYS